MPRQLHRFVSFAFAVADLLIEVDEKGTICFVLGAASGLTHQGDEAWLGKPWLELFHPDDRALVQATAASLTAGARCGTLPVRLAGSGSADEGRQALLNACRLPGNGNRLSCALSAASPTGSDNPTAKPRDPESGLLDPASFATAAAGIGAAAREAGRDLGLMFLDLPELAGLAANRPATCADLVHRIGTLLRAGAIDGDAAGR
ncbi:PAS domain-containing protein, partial [Skermanella aerolata]